MKLLVSHRTETSDPNTVKAILLIVGLLGACNDAAADLASDTFLNIRMENYFRNPLEFPEPGFDIISAAEPLPEVASQRVIQSESLPELMRGEAWMKAQPSADNVPEGNTAALWSLVASTVLCLFCGCYLSVVGTQAKTHRQRRRVRTTIRMMAS